jgi:hypothetical protein
MGRPSASALLMQWDVSPAPVRFERTAVNCVAVQQDYQHCEFGDRSASGFSGLPVENVRQTT